MAEPKEEIIPTRASLIQRLKNWRDEASWQDFFDTYWNLIFSIGLKSGLTEAEAEDVVQETMLSVAKRMPDFKYDPAIGSFKSWLGQLVRWRIADQLRKRQPPRVAVPVSDADATVPSADPASQLLDRIWDDEWEKNMLEAAVSRVKRRLDPQRFQIFDCYVNKEWPPEKVARTFRISVGQVYLAKHRVANMIKRELKRLEREMT